MEEEHKITITFNAEGSILYTLDVSGRVYPDQFGMLAEAFRYQAVRMKEDARAMHLMAEQERQQRNSIAVPGGVLKP